MNKLISIQLSVEIFNLIYTKYDKRSINIVSIWHLTDNKELQIRRERNTSLISLYKWFKREN
jgi:hypothetical protein